MGFGHEDFAGPPLDLNERLIRHPAATFFMRLPAGSAESILIVDRSLDPGPGVLVVAVEDGTLCLRRVEAGREIEVWGVVTYTIRKER